MRNSADPSVPWVVQKYGGTSVGKSLDSITQIVEYVPVPTYALFDLCLQVLYPNSRVALVCSARSSHTKLWERQISYSKLRARRSPRLEVHPARRLCSICALWHADALLPQAVGSASLGPRRRAL